MILPGTMPLSVPTVTSEITQYLPDSWKPIIDADIDGPESSPARIDAERPMFGQRALTRRLARSIFVGSAPTLHSAHRGIDRKRVWLGTAVAGDTVGNFGSAIDLLSQRATYLYAEGSRYGYDTQQSVTRTAADHAEGLRERPEEVWREIVDRLRATEQRARGGFAGVHVAPDSSAEVSDTEDARLVVLHPSQPHSRGSEDSSAMRFATEAFERRGSAQRTNRNMVVFLAADSKRLEELAEATRDYLAWTWVGSRREELNLSPEQVKQVDANSSRSDGAVKLRIAQAYHWALVPEQPDPQRPALITVEKTDGANERLAERVTDKLTRGPARRVDRGPHHPARPRPAAQDRVGARAPHCRGTLGVLLPLPVPDPAARPAGAGRGAAIGAVQLHMGTRRLRLRRRLRRGQRLLQRAGTARRQRAPRPHHRLDPVSGPGHSAHAAP
jgi:hypothetical protein